MSAFLYGLAIGFAPTVFFFSRWLSTRTDLRLLRETTEDIRAWDTISYGEETTSGRHAIRIDLPATPEPEPVTVPIVPGTNRTVMWHDLINVWTEAHDPAAAHVPEPRLQPAAYADTQLLPIVGKDVTRLPQISAMSLRSRPEPEPQPASYPGWGPEPETTLRPAPLWGVIVDGVRVGLAEFETSGQWINTWLLVRLETWLTGLIPPPVPSKVNPRPKRVYPALTASTHRWEYRGGAR